MSGYSKVRVGVMLPHGLQEGRGSIPASTAARISSTTREDHRDRDHSSLVFNISPWSSFLSLRWFLLDTLVPWDGGARDQCMAGLFSSVSPHSLGDLRAFSFSGHWMPFLCRWISNQYHQLRSLTTRLYPPQCLTDFSNSTSFTRVSASLLPCPEPTLPNVFPPSFSCKNIPDPILSLLPHIQCFGLLQGLSFKIYPESHLLSLPLLSRVMKITSLAPTWSLCSPTICSKVEKPEGSF